MRLNAVMELLLCIFGEVPMKKKALVRGVLIFIALAALCACAWCVWYIVQYYQGQSFGKTMQDAGPSGAEIDLAAERVKIPVDFDALREINPDIYAWVEIPDTNISFAVLQHADDNGFYMNHKEDGAFYSGGSVYSEDYNAKDFSDPMTVLYGHNLRSGHMFAQLNDFADVEVFQAHRNIYVYLPDRVLVYEIFAATPHSSEHLLATYDFTNRAQFQAFFAELFATRNLNAQFLENGQPEYDTHRVLTLSTCYRSDNHQRFLVMGRLVAEIPGK